MPKVKTVEELESFGIRELTCDLCHHKVSLKEIGYVNGFVLPRNDGSLVLCGVVKCRRCLNGE